VGQAAIGFHYEDVKHAHHGVGHFYRAEMSNAQFAQML
jgi:hypothetical protein